MYIYDTMNKIPTKRTNSTSFWQIVIDSISNQRPILWCPIDLRVTSRNLFPSFFLFLSTVSKWNGLCKQGIRTTPLLIPPVPRNWKPIESKRCRSSLDAAEEAEERRRGCVSPPACVRIGVDDHQITRLIASTAIKRFIGPSRLSQA